MFQLFPREETFLPQFARAAEIILEAATALDELAADFTDVELKVAHQTFGLLSRTWITPIDREDIHALVKALDDVLDFIDAAANRFVLYKIPEPRPGLKQATEILVQSAHAIRRASGLLGDLKHSAKILEICVEINRLENEADTLNRISIGRLFETEKDPITLLKWKEIYEVLEEATDRCEDVANVFEQIVLKSS